MLLNTASALYWGATPVTRAYLGATEVWSGGSGTPPLFTFSDDFAANNADTIWNAIREENGGTVAWNAGGFIRTTTPPFNGTDIAKAVLDYSNWGGSNVQAFPGDTVIVDARYYFHQANTSEIFLFDVEMGDPGVSGWNQPGARVRTKNGFVSLERQKIGLSSADNVQGVYTMPQNTWTHLIWRIDLAHDSTGRTRLWGTTDDVNHSLSFDVVGPNMPIPGSTAGVPSGTTPWVDYLQVAQTAGGNTVTTTVDMTAARLRVWRGTAPEAENFA